ITRLPRSNSPILAALSAGSDELDDLEKIEPRVAHHWCHDRAAAQVDDAPERAEKCSGDDGIDTLHEVSGSKRQAGDDDSHFGTTKRASEPPQEKRALDFLANPAGDDDEPGEH